MGDAVDELTTGPVGEVCADAIRVSFEHNLGWALAAVLRSYRHSAATALADLPGGPRGYQVLSAAAQEAPSSQQALGLRVGVDRSVMTYLVDDLVAAGLVERRPDPTDRRARRVVVTPAGHERLDLLDERLTLVDDHVLRSLSTGERVTLRAMLRRVATERGASPDPCGLSDDASAPSC